MPPKGFEAWWKFAQANDVRIVSSTTLSLPPSSLDRRVSRLIPFSSFLCSPGRRRSFYLLLQTLDPIRSLTADVRSLLFSQYDQIHTSITPFLALDPILLGERLTELLEKEPFSSEIQISSEEPINISGVRGVFPRPKQMAALLYVQAQLSSLLPRAIESKARARAQPFLSFFVLVLFWGALLAAKDSVGTSPVDSEQEKDTLVKLGETMEL